jgi:bifunctional non-homologous end joining protein LigD
MSLDEYKRKRNFTKTPEPDFNEILGDRSSIIKNYAKIINEDDDLSKSKPRFVVQRHEATRLHYDFRLESLKKNVLLSWAIPKGPSLDPSVKRLAIQTEDHPVSYLLFEGIIPKGNYGAGTVIVWDVGKYTIQDNTLLEDVGREQKDGIQKGQDVSDIIKDRKITFTLFGHKLKGRFSLIGTNTENQWLLIKQKDEFSNHSSNKNHKQNEDITISNSESVLTGKTNNDLITNGMVESENNIRGQNQYKIRNNNINTNTEDHINSSTFDHTSSEVNNQFSLHSLEKTFFEQTKPMLASLAEKPFSHGDWAFEIKWDGVRAMTLVNKENKSCYIKSRSGEIITHRYPEINNILTSALNEEMFKDYVILDGEIVVLDKYGVPNFQNHQKRMNINSIRSIEILSNLYPAVYYIFDILYIDNQNLKELAFVKRRKILTNLIKKVNEKIRLSEFVEEFGIDVFDAVRKMNLEGVIAKHKNSQYHSGMRSKEWLKIKNIKTQDCVIIGFTRGEGNREKYFGSLLLAAMDNNQKKTTTADVSKVTTVEHYDQLRFIGHTGSGFDLEALRTIHSKLKKIEVAICPIGNVPYLNRETTWVKPMTVVEVKFNDWTNNKIMRAPIFLRIRQDKLPSQCTIETSNPVTNDDGVSVNIRKDNEDVSISRSKKENHQINTEMRFSNLKKEFWTATKHFPSITKGDLIEYYAKVSEYLLPHLIDRPLSLSRYPDGIHGEAFYQKDWKLSKPHYVHTVKVYSESNSDKLNYIVCNNSETLLWLVNLGCIEIHPWYSKVRDYNQCNQVDKIETEECGLNYPDFIVFDLDPYLELPDIKGSKEPGYSLSAFKETAEIAYDLKDILDELKFKSFVKTSGKTGIHVFLPIMNLYTYKQTREFARIISRILDKRRPGKITTEWKTSSRKGKVFFDYNQNSIGKTLASVYSVRPIENATVSVPLKWEELIDTTPTDYTILTVPGLYKRKNDPWKGILSCKQNLEEILNNVSDFKV